MFKVPVAAKDHYDCLTNGTCKAVRRLLPSDYLVSMLHKVSILQNTDSYLPETSENTHVLYDFFCRFHSSSIHSDSQILTMLHFNRKTDVHFIFCH